MSSIEEMADNADLEGYLASREVDEAPEVQFSPQMIKLVQEIHGDDLMIEACLAWAREKKEKILGAKLVALYGEEFIKNKLAEAEAKESS